MSLLPIQGLPQNWWVTFGTMKIISSARIITGMRRANTHHPDVSDHQPNPEQFERFLDWKECQKLLHTRGPAVRFLCEFALRHCSVPWNPAQKFGVKYATDLSFTNWADIPLADAVGGVQGYCPLQVITPTSSSQLCLRRVGLIEVKQPEFEFPGCKLDSDRDRVPVQSQNMIVSIFPCGAPLKWCWLSIWNSFLPESLAPPQDTHVHRSDSEPGSVTVDTIAMGCEDDPLSNQPHHLNCLHEAGPRSSCHSECCWVGLWCLREGWSRQRTHPKLGFRVQGSEQPVLIFWFHKRQPTLYTLRIVTGPEVLLSPKTDMGNGWAADCFDLDHSNRDVRGKCDDPGQ